MGVLKGTLAGIMFPKIMENAANNEMLSLPLCIFSDGNQTFWQIQKDVIAKMRLNNKKMGSSSSPNTANAAVMLALLELYPCLLDQ